MKVRNNVKKSSNRLLQKEDKKIGILNYGDDNLYPQRMLLLKDSSPTAKTCVETYAKFIKGGGFRDLDFYKAVVNLDRQTMDKILTLIANDYATFRGFALHVNITPGGKVAEIYHVPFEQVRKASATKKAETGFDYAVYTDWNKQHNSSIKAEEITWLNEFNLDPAVISEQIDKAIELDVEYKGQLFYFSADEGSYPLASFDVVEESIYSEIQSDIETTNNFEQGFTKKGMFIHKGKFEEDEHGNSPDREEFEEAIEEFVGGDGPHVITVDVDADEEIPEYKTLDTTINDKMYEYTDQKVLNKIIRNFKVPKILLSVTEGGGFFNQEQVRDAVEFYNLVTLEERIGIEAIIFSVCSSALVVTNKTGDYSIAPIEFKIKKSEPPQSLNDLVKDPSVPVETKRFMLVKFYGLDMDEALEMIPEIKPEADKRLLVDILGVGGTQAMQGILADPVLTPAQKKSALMIIFGLNEEDANSLAGIITNQ